MSQSNSDSFKVLLKNDNRCCCFRRQVGASLAVSLVILAVVSILGISAAQIAIEEDKASRSDRDRQIAFQAAEAALVDAEVDIENSPDTSRSRSHVFSKYSTIGFPGEDEPGCRAGEGSIYLGLCRHTYKTERPAWLVANLTGEPSSAVNSVPYGTFTGKSFQVGQGTLPVKLPRYVIELMADHLQGESADQVSYFFRVTAIGFGAREETRVVLQTLYRKANGEEPTSETDSNGSEGMKAPVKRFSWREIVNWQELWNAANNE